MYVVYPAYFMKDEDGYSVMFPDLPGALTCGETLSEAMEMAVDCLAGFIHTNDEFGDETAAPSDIKNHTRAGAAKAWECSENDVEIYPIGVDVYDYAKKHFRPLVHKNLTIERWVNEEAKALGINFSKTLQDALIEKIRLARG